jgi:N-hydroxyarylamine O-acetyltransferase
VDGASSRQLGTTYTLRRDDRLWVLVARSASGETDLYEFTEDPQTPTDVEIANYYTSTHPASVFRRTLTIQRVTATERITLRGETLTRQREGSISEERIERACLADVVREIFDIGLPDGPYVFETFAALTT